MPLVDSYKSLIQSIRQTLLHQHGGIEALLNSHAHRTLGVRDCDTRPSRNVTQCEHRSIPVRYPLKAFIRAQVEAAAAGHRGQLLITQYMIILIASCC